MSNDYDDRMRRAQAEAEEARRKAAEEEEHRRRSAQADLVRKHHEKQLQGKYE